MTERPARHTKRFLAAFYALAPVFAVRGLAPDQSLLFELPAQILRCVALGWWAVADARHRGHPIPMLSKPWFYLFAPLVVPGYVFWSRGWRGAGWVAVHLAAWIVFETVAAYALVILLSVLARL